MTQRPAPPQGVRPYFKDVCIHSYKHVDTSKFKVPAEKHGLKWKVVDRFFCERCLQPQTKVNYYTLEEYR